MKNVRMALASLMLALCLVVAGSNGAKAQAPNVGQALAGLINVGVVATDVVEINGDIITIGDVTITDVVDVQDVLNNNEVRILNNVLNNSPIASNNSDILTNLLRDANILTGTQVVVGVLSGGIVLVQDVVAQ